MPKTLTTPWDAANHLKTEDDMADYLEAALEDGDPVLVAAALGDIARAKRPEGSGRAAASFPQILWEAQDSER